MHFTVYHITFIDQFMDTLRLPRYFKNIYLCSNIIKYSLRTFFFLCVFCLVGKQM